MARLQVGFSSEPCGSLERHHSSPVHSLVGHLVTHDAGFHPGIPAADRRGVWLFLPVLGVTELKGFTETDYQAGDRFLWVLVGSQVWRARSLLPRGPWVSWDGEGLRWSGAHSGLQNGLHSVASQGHWSLMDLGPLALSLRTICEL